MSEEIEVTAAMISAGLSELREHSFAEDAGYVLECVYRAMGYATRASASETSASK